MASTAKAATETQVEVAEEVQAAPKKALITAYTLAIGNLCQGLITETEQPLLGKVTVCAVTIHGKFNYRTIKESGKSKTYRYFFSDVTGGAEEQILAFIRQVNPNHIFDFRAAQLTGSKCKRGQISKLKRPEGDSFTLVMPAEDPKSLNLPSKGERIALTAVIKCITGQRPLYTFAWARLDEGEGLFYPKVEPSQLTGTWDSSMFLPPASPQTEEE